MSGSVGDFLIDTNVISEFVRPDPSERVIRWFESADPSTLFASVVKAIRERLKFLPGTESIMIFYDDGRDISEAIPFDFSCSGRGRALWLWRLSQRRAYKTAGQETDSCHASRRPAHSLQSLLHQPS